jgi:parvulin-like peptidyl-prolyl isomerase
LPKLQNEGDLLATVGPVRFTSKELEARLNAQSPFLRERFRSNERRAEFLEKEIQFELLAQEAWSRGLHEDPQIVSELKKKMVQRLLTTELEQRLKGQEIGENDLRTEYVKRRDEYKKPERVRLSQIVRYVKNDAERAKARKLLFRLKTEISGKERKNNPAAFSEAAAQHSEDTGTKKAGGELQFMTSEELAERYGKDVAATVFEQAKVGDTFVADAQDAVVLFRKTGKRRAVERTLEMVKPQLRAQVQRERRNAAVEAFLEELKKKQGVNVDRAALEKLQIDFAGDRKKAGGKTP